MLMMPSILNNDVFDDFFNDFDRPLRSLVQVAAPEHSLMKTDVRETGNSYELDMELPGYKKEDVKAELKDGYMTISAETKKESEDKDENGKFIRRERYSGSVRRSFYVGKDLRQEDIKARFEDGILKISVPKKQPQPEVEENHYIAIEG